MRQELVELLDVLHERTQLDARHPAPIDPSGAIPIHSHATYGLYELIAAYGLARPGVLRETREGVLWAEAHAADLFFITLNKADEDYSPTTRYQDYPISPTLFHWESQSPDRDGVANRPALHQPRCPRLPGHPVRSREPAR